MRTPIVLFFGGMPGARTFPSPVRALGMFSIDAGTQGAVMASGAFQKLLVAVAR